MANTFKYDTFRSSKFLAYITIGLLSLGIIGAVLFIIFSFGMMLSPDWELDIGESGPLPVFYMAIGFVSLLEIPVRIATIVLFLVWEYRAFTNLSPLKARNLEFSPGWAVGWWFIPFANLVKPYQAMKELWRDSDPEFDEDLGFLSSSMSAPAIFGFWWALWILKNLSDRLVQSADRGTGEVSHYLPLLLIISSVIALGSAGLLIMIIHDIVNRQEARSKKIGLSTEQLPPPPPTFDPQV